MGTFTFEIVHHKMFVGRVPFSSRTEQRSLWTVKKIGTDQFCQYHSVIDLYEWVSLFGLLGQSVQPYTRSRWSLWNVILWKTEDHVHNIRSLIIINHFYIWNVINKVKNLSWRSIDNYKQILEMWNINTHDLYKISLLHVEENTLRCRKRQFVGYSWKYFDSPVTIWNVKQVNRPYHGLT